MEYLGFWVTKIGTRPINKKLEAIIKMTSTNTKKEVREFIGLLNNYMDMWAR